MCWMRCAIALVVTKACALLPYTCNTLSLNDSIADWLHPCVSLTPQLILCMLTLHYRHSAASQQLATDVHCSVHSVSCSWVSQAYLLHALLCNAVAPHSFLSDGNLQAALYGEDRRHRSVLAGSCPHCIMQLAGPHHSSLHAQPQHRRLSPSCTPFSEVVTQDITHNLNAFCINCLGETCSTSGSC